MPKYKTPWRLQVAVFHLSLSDLEFKRNEVMMVPIDGSTFLIRLMLLDAIDQELSIRRTLAE